MKLGNDLRTTAEGGALRVEKTDETPDWRGFELTEEVAYDPRGIVQLDLREWQPDSNASYTVQLLCKDAKGNFLKSVSLLAARKAGTYESPVRWYRSQIPRGTAKVSFNVGLMGKNARGLVAGFYWGVSDKPIEEAPRHDDKASSNLITLVNLENPDYRINGVWQREKDGSITSPLDPGDDPFARLKLPFTPPEEYDFVVDFTRNTGSGPVLTLPHAGKSFQCQLSPLLGLESIRGKYGLDSPALEPFILEDGQKWTCIVAVRGDSISVYMDDALVLRYPTNYSDVSGNPSWDKGVGTNAVGIGTYKGSTTTFHSVKIYDVKGKGRPMPGG